MASDSAVEIVIRELQHITGSGEPGECDQKDQPQHVVKRWLEVLLAFSQTKRSLNCKLGPRQPPSSVPRRRQSQGCRLLGQGQMQTSR